MITAILSDLIQKDAFRANTQIVNLNGYIHTDDAAALKSITKQMKLETAVDGKVFTTFADNLAFLLDCLKSGDRIQSKSVIFILDEFDLFCAHSNQTLIYNLFDVAQSAQAPICVIGLTRRNDVIEMLEKRVKSRFSHRQIFLFNENRSFEGQMDIFLSFLKLPVFKVSIKIKINLKHMLKCERKIYVIMIINICNREFYRNPIRIQRFMKGNQKYPYCVVILMLMIMQVSSNQIL